MNPERWRRIEAICHAAQSRPFRERSAYLAAACAGDDDLRREVESLLAQTGALSDHFLGESAQSVGMGSVTATGDSSAPLIGSRLGQFHIVDRLGMGGMGEVYRARDTKLGRDVALKILPHAFTSDPERLARFEREARVLASLNHPHIGTIYGVEDTGGLRALVLELIDGQTLADRIRHGPVPLKEALTVAGQLVAALDAAHERGIVHRDFKPANIKITPEGVVKVLDFGIAKASGEAASPEASRTPTVTVGRTHEGLIIGTAAYMSPEQARGQPVDKRTDIWAFGCVLYEMLTGRLAFAGETFSDMMVAILERQPDWILLPTETPSAVRRLMQRCLEKDPRRRLRDIGDARHSIEDVTTGEPDVHAATSSHPGRLAGLLGAVALSTAFGSWLLWGATTDAPARNVQLQRLTDLVGIEESPAISPDGKSVAFVARAGGKRQIWQRLLAGGAPLQITRDDTDHEQPRWVPDSSAVIYYVPSATPGEHGAIWEVAALGGEPRRIASSLSGGDISHDGQRIALFRFEKTQIALVVVNRDGSDTDHLRPLPPMSSFAYPRWSPDDRWIAFQQENLGSGFDWRVLVVPATPDGEARELARSAYLEGLSWLPSGAGVVYSASTGSTVLYPPTFNLRSVERDSTEDRQLTFGDQSYMEPDVHMSGMLAASRSRMLQSNIWKFPVNGSPAENTRRRIQITHQTGYAQTPSISPDESEVVYLSDAGGHGNLWIARTDGSGVRQITSERNPTTSVGVPMWSPAGNQIVFILTQPGGTGLSLVNRDGSGLRNLVTSGYSSAWSVDGQWVYYSRDTNDGLCIEKIGIQGGRAISIRCDNANSSVPTADGSVLYFVNLLIKSNGIVDHEIARAHPENGPSEVLARVAGSRVPVARRMLNPVLSPDGQWLTFPLTDGGTSNIWGLPTNGPPVLRPFTDFGNLSVLIARRVSWSPDNKFLYAAVADTDADIVLLDGLLR